MRQKLIGTIAVLVLLAGPVTQIGWAADPPTPKLALGFKPKQTDVEYDRPEQSEYSKCKVTVVRKGKASGWVVLGPGGETLRKFMDTDGDNIVDHWGYYLRGLEVYRDIDSDADNKIDQFRWLNTEGSRWGIDEDADGFVDQWKRISVEEASREAVRALTTGNFKILKPLLINDQDMANLGLSPSVAKQLREQISDAASKLSKNKTAAKGLNRNTRWLQFINTIPAMIPADQVGGVDDLFVYENAMATVETGSQTALVQIGELVRVGDGWKLASIPQLMDKNSVQVGGILMQPAIAETASSPVGTESENAVVRKLIAQLQELDRNSPELTASRSETSKYYSSRADLLMQLRKNSDTRELRDQWTRQLADGLAAGSQTGVYPDGLKRLKTLETSVQASPAEIDTLPYVIYRRQLAEYNVTIRDASNEKRAEIQKQWLETLESFVEKFPKASDAPEAILQIAIATEFQGDSDVAEKWYQKLIDGYPDAPPSPRATGALKRIQMTGKPFQLSGQGLAGETVDTSKYRGKVLLVLYWATWCIPCTEDLPQIQELYKKYHGDGFEIVGISLDSDPASIAPYLKQHKVTWPQIHEPGGLDSPPARAYGVITVPTMFLVGRDGNVVHRNLDLTVLKSDLPELLENKTSKLGAGSSFKDSKTK